MSYPMYRLADGLERSSKVFKVEADTACGAPDYPVMETGSTPVMNAKCVRTQGEIPGLLLELLSERMRSFHRETLEGIFMSVIHGYAPGSYEMIGNQRFIRDFINAFRPMSAVMSFVKEGSVIRPPGSILNDIRNLARQGTFSIDLCLEYLKVPRDVHHSYNVTISRQSDKGQSRIQINNYPPIVF